MNIQNISSLSEQLQSLGFTDFGYLLLKRIAFKPTNFILHHKTVKEDVSLNFDLFFEMDKVNDEYSLKYYDAVFQKNFQTEIINSIDTRLLENKMSEINWKAAFDLSTNPPWNTEHRPETGNEKKVEEVMNEFMALENTDQGKVFCANLKLKHWQGLPYQELFPNLAPVKNKFDISQRFYLTNSTPGITIDEAFRFLQNKWLEKEMKTKQKEDTCKSSDNDKADVETTASGTGLLQKRRIVSNKKNRQTILK